MTNEEAINLCDEAYGALCKAYNDPEKEDCPGCPFNGEDYTCPLGELIERFMEADENFEKMKKARDMWIEQWRALEYFVMDIKKAELWCGSTIEVDDDGMHHVTSVSEIETGEELMRAVYGESWREMGEHR